MKITTKKMIEVQDWDDVVKETYGRVYSFQQQDGCQGRGSVNITVPDEEADDFENEIVPEIVNGYEMGVKFSSWLARDPKAPLPDHDDFGLMLWWERNFYPNLQMVANDLHAKGLLEAGDYIINIDW